MGAKKDVILLRRRLFVQLRKMLGFQIMWKLYVLVQVQFSEHGITLLVLTLMTTTEPLCYAWLGEGFDIAMYYCKS